MKRPRTKTVTMPNIDDIIMMILGLSEAVHYDEWIVNVGGWDYNRPTGWPSARYILKFYGFKQNSTGWREFVDQFIGMECVSISYINAQLGEIRMNKRWNMANKPEYTARPNGDYQAATWNDGFQICEETYRRTGRMVLR